MKKILLVAAVVVALFGYMTYGWMHSHGWTVFSKDTTEPASISTEVIVKEPLSVPLLFVGDVMLGRYVETLMAKSGNELYAFEGVKDYLKQHVTIANLEGPIPSTHKPTPINGMSFSFPSSSPRILKEGGMTAVSLANNHMFDRGAHGYEETKQALGAGNVAHFGGYTPTEDDYFKTTLGDKEVIVYGITMIATGWDEAQAMEVTKKVRKQHSDAHLIVFIHWGDEYKTQNIYQRAFAHTLIDSGVDTIIGSHPHIIQGVEVYKGKPIFYSLGNFIFDQYQEPRLEDGMMVRMDITDKEYVYDIIPIHSSRSVPTIATSTKRSQILQSISKQSDSGLQAAILEGKLHISK
jgi:poly-gamma-glutamate capsule biosynthesis protein CapA/YwtB (metallophosphatase superfamily)